MTSDSIETRPVRQRHVQSKDVSILPLGLGGTLQIPGGSKGVVVFAHGSGSSRMSPRNIFVADSLNEAGFATLLFDLLTVEEERDRRNVFDITLLANRLVAAMDAVSAEAATSGLPIGLFGASTGAAAALTAAADRSDAVSAVVSRGGRPDLAGDALAAVRAPVCLIVGGDDPEVLALNRSAMERLAGHAELKIIPGATHLFSEPGALDAVVEEATRWFERYLSTKRT